MIQLRHLHLTHRWLGIGLGLFVLLWFLSGLVMLFVPYPSLSLHERLSKLPTLDLANVRLSAQQAWAMNGYGGEPDRLRLNMLLQRPVYHFMQDMQHGGMWSSVWADTGQPLEINNTVITANARAFAPQASIVSHDIINRDQWSISSALNAHRPLHRIALNDTNGTELYVSSHTGEIVLDTHRSERAWNWAGSVIHWVYFTPLRVERELWRQVIMWTSGAALLLIALGMWLGIQRLRVKRRYSGNRVSPYRGWARWHHLSGLIVGIFCITWLFSGWLSVQPFNWISSRQMSEQETSIWAGGKVRLDEMKLPPTIAVSGIKEIEWTKFNGKAQLLGYAEHRNYLMDRFNGAALPSFTKSALVDQAGAMQPGLKPASSVWLDHGDLYYQPSPEHQAAKVLRIEFADAAQTSYYIDPETAQIVSSENKGSRLYRWLFNALHCMDFPPLKQHKIGRQLLIITLSIGGILISITGIMLGWRRLGKKL